MGIEAELEGLDEVLGLLDRVSDKTVLDATKQAMRQELQKIRTAAILNCPEKTGALRQSIKTRTRMEGNEFVGEVVAGKEYAVFVEMGTGPRGEANHTGVDPEAAAKVTYNVKGWVHAKRKESGKEYYYYSRGMPARPFLYPALKARQGKVYRAMARAISRAVKGGGT